MRVRKGTAMRYVLTAIFTLLASGAVAQNCAVSPSISMHLESPTNLIGCGPTWWSSAPNQSAVGIRVSGGEFCSLGKKAKVEITGIPNAWDINDGSGWRRKGSSKLIVDVSYSDAARVQVRARRSNPGYFGDAQHNINIVPQSTSDSDYLDASEYSHEGFKNWRLDHRYFRTCR